MKLKIYTIDAFTSEVFSGNPAAVVLLDEKLPDKIMQKIASEMNLSETAFLIPLPETNSNNNWINCKKFGLRWMTPTNEVNLCGHATLASAHTLFFEAKNKNDVLEFETLSGILKARKAENNLIVLDLPLLSPCDLTDCEKEICRPLINLAVGSMEVRDVKISKAAKKLLIKLDTSRENLEKAEPPIDELLKLHDGSLVKGIILTTVGDETYHFFSRYFAPWNGIPEDPVTGSAHSVLGPYWSEVINKKNLKCRQCSPRGGDLSLKIRDDGRIDIAGSATTVLEGVFNI